MVLPGSLPSPVRQPLFVTSLKLLPRPPSSVVAALTIADRGQLRRRVIFRVHVTRREKRDSSGIRNVGGSLSSSPTIQPQGRCESQVWGWGQSVTDRAPTTQRTASMRAPTCWVVPLGPPPGAPPGAGDVSP